MATTQQYAQHAIGPGVFRRVGQSKNKIRLVLDGGTGTTALAEPVPVVQSSLPSASTSSTGYISTDNYTCARIFFGGTDAANETINYQVVLWYPVEPVSGADELSYMPVVVAKGVATLGATTYTTDDFGAASNLIADTITDTRGHSGVVVNSPGGDSKAWIDVDLHNASGIEIETDRGTAASADVFLQFGEGPVPFELHGLVGGINDTTTDSLHGKIGTDSEMGDASLYDMLTGGVGTTGCAITPVTHSDITTDGSTLFTASGSVLVTNVIVCNTTIAFDSAGDTAVLDVKRAVSGNSFSILTADEADLTAYYVCDSKSAGAAEQLLLNNHTIVAVAQNESFTSNGTAYFLATYIRVTTGATLTT